MSTTKALNAKFGNPSTLTGKLNQTWYKQNVVMVVLPFAMRIAGHESQGIRAVPFHKAGKTQLVNALNDVWQAARWAMKQKHGFDKTSAFYDNRAHEYLAELGLDLFGGTFCYRRIRGSSGLSTHSWAVAIDIDPQHNALGTVGRMPKWFVGCFTRWGFAWGGEWKGRKDPMHLELKA